MKATKNDLLLRLPRRRCKLSVRWANATKIILLLRSDICGGHDSATGVASGSCAKKPAPGPADKSRRTPPLCSAAVVASAFRGGGGCFTGGPLCVVVSLYPPAPPRPAAPVGGSGERKADLGVRCVIAVVRKVGVSLARGAKLIKGKGHAKIGT